MILDLIWKTIFDVKIVYTFHHVAIINYLYQLSFFNSTVVDRPRILFFLTKCFFFFSGPFKSLPIVRSQKIPIVPLWHQSRLQTVSYMYFLKFIY